ncbi:MAG TPA: nitroreductase family deazaflavin-dependent oxidoreductase [Anaerolineales bacterium]
MIPPITMFFAPRMHQMDFWMLKLTRGKYTLSEIGGWTIVQLTTTGSKSGQKRTMPLIATVDGERIGLIASSFGRKNNPGWYYNLKSNPVCFVNRNGETVCYEAREADGSEYEKYWQAGISVFAGYDAYKKRASHRHIPVMVLEPKE